MGIYFTKQYITMTNVAVSSSYPMNIYCSIDNFPGYTNYNGVATGKVVKYGIKTIQTVQTTPQTLNIEYESTPIRWTLNRNFGNLNFRIFYDDNATAQSTPLPF